MRGKGPSLIWKFWNSGTEINIRLEKLSTGNFIEIKLSHHQTQNNKNFFFTWEAKNLHLKEKNIDFTPVSHP